MPIIDKNLLKFETYLKFYFLLHCNHCTEYQNLWESAVYGSLKPTKIPAHNLVIKILSNYHY